MPETITVLGASARAAVQSVVRAGFAAFAGDLFADLDLAALCPGTRSTNYPHDLLDIAKSAPPGPWLYTGGLENHPALVDAIAAVKPLLGNPGKVLRAVRDPQRVTSVLRAADLPVPRVALTADALSRDGSWLVKPRRSAGGAHIRVLAGAADATLGDALGGGVYFQERIDGVSCSAAFVAVGGESRLWGVTRQLVGESWTGATGFQYCGSLGPLPLSETARARIVRVGEILAHEFELTGLFGVDGFLRQECFWPVEVNPRYTASLEVLERAGGASAVAMHIAACRRELPPQLGDDVATPDPGYIAGKAILFADRDVSIGPEFLAVVDALNASAPLPQAADIPQPQCRIARGRPIVTMLAEGCDFDAVLNQLKTRASIIDGVFRSHSRP